MSKPCKPLPTRVLLEPEPRWVLLAEALALGEEATPRPETFTAESRGYRENMLRWTAPIPSLLSAFDLAPPFTIECHTPAAEQDYREIVPRWRLPERLLEELAAYPPTEQP